MLAARDVTMISDCPCGITFECCDYGAGYEGSNYVLADIVGLSERDHGVVPHQDAVRRTIDFTRNQDKSFNLIALVMRRGRTT